MFDSLLYHLFPLNETCCADKLCCKKLKLSIFRLHFIQTFGYTVGLDLGNMALAWALLDLLIILGLGPTTLFRS